MPAPIDYGNLTGLKFGNLTVISKINQTTSLCRCDCSDDEYVEINTNKLVKGKIKSCGCLNSVRDITGKIIGNFIVLARVDLFKSGQSRWLAKCLLCGNAKTFYIETITRTRTKGCGCLQGKNLFTGEGELSGTYINYVQRRAKKRGQEFTVTKKELIEIYNNQKGKCAISGLEIPLIKKFKQKDGPQLASLDRKDSSKGYTKENCQWLHWRVNVAKNNMSDNELIDLCEVVYKNKRKEKEINWI